MTLKSDAKFEEKLICCFENDTNMVNFDLSTQNSQNFHFDWFPLCKVHNFWPKKYRWVMFHDNEEWCKVSRKTDLWLGKWHEEMSKFLPWHLKVSKLGLWWDSFIQKKKCMSLKFTEELCVMTIKNETKFKKELTCHFKTDMRNLTKFDPSKNLQFNGLLLTKVYNIWAKKVQRSYVWSHWKLMQILFYFITNFILPWK